MSWTTYAIGAAVIAGGYYLWRRSVHDESGRPILHGDVTSNQVTTALHETATPTQGGQVIVGPEGITVTRSEATSVLLNPSTPSILPAGEKTTIGAGVIINPNPGIAPTNQATLLASSAPPLATASIAPSGSPRPPLTPAGASGAIRYQKVTAYDHRWFWESSYPTFAVFLRTDMGNRIQVYSWATRSSSAKLATTIYDTTFHLGAAPGATPGAVVASASNDRTIQSLARPKPKAPVKRTVNKNIFRNLFLEP